MSADPIQTDAGPVLPAAPTPLAGPRHRIAGDLVAVDDPWFEHVARAAQERALPLRWVVIDDLYEDLCELAISPWPRLTDEGRLVFADSEEQYFVVEMEVTSLWELVRSARRLQYQDTPSAVIDRRLRVGDAFAAVVQTSEADAGAPAAGHRATVEFPLGPEGIADVTAEARVFAKVQEAVAEALPLHGRELDDLGKGLAADGGAESTA